VLLAKTANHGRVLLAGRRRLRRECVALGLELGDASVAVRVGEQRVRGRAARLVRLRARLAQFARALVGRLIGRLRRRVPLPTQLVELVAVPQQFGGGRVAVALFARVERGRVRGHLALGGRLQSLQLGARLVPHVSERGDLVGALVELGAQSGKVGVGVAAGGAARGGGVRGRRGRRGRGCEGRASGIGRR
jgi:hypothetical protein